MTRENVSSKDCGVQTLIASRSKQFMLPRNPVVMAKFGLDVPELVDVVFGMRSGGSDLNYLVRVRLLI